MDERGFEVGRVGFEGLDELCDSLDTRTKPSNAAAILTLDLFKTLLVQPVDLDMFLLEELQASSERIRNLQVVVIRATTSARIVEGDLHLTYGCDHFLCFFQHLVLLGRHLTDLVV